MKTLKFRKKLSELILAGEKDTTWRLFDDKDLSVGDEISFVVWETGEEMYKTYTGYYNREVTKNSPVKVIKFELIKNMNV